MARFSYRNLIDLSRGSCTFQLGAMLILEILFLGESLDTLLKLLSLAPLAILFDRFRRSLAILPLVIKSFGREGSEVEIGRSGNLSQAVRISSLIRKHGIWMRKEPIS